MVLTMKTLVLHHILDIPGGGERVSLSIIKALIERGHDVFVVTTQPLTPRFRERLKGVKGFFHILPLRLNAFGIYQRFLMMLSKYVSGLEPDVIVNTYGNPLPILGREKTPYYIYCHFASLAIFKGVVPSKYKGLWSVYGAPYYSLLHSLSRLTLKSQNVTAIINSHFSARLFQKVYGVKPVVIYPPVDLEFFSKAFHKGRREKLIVTISRFTKEKKLENAIKLLTLLPSDVKLAMIGGLTPVNSSYYLSLTRLARKLGVKDRVVFKPNCPGKELLEILSKASVFLHTMPYEHFGVAIVEAMAAGLIPVVHDSGGPREFVPSRYRYKSLEEAAEIIMSSLNAKLEEREKVARIAERFSEDRFKEEVVKVIESGA